MPRSPRDLLSGTAGLVVVLAIATGLAIVGAGAVIGHELERSIKKDALESAETTGRVFAGVTLEPDEFAGGVVTEEALEDLDEAVKAPGGVVAARVYDGPGRVVYGSSPKLASSPVAADEMREAFDGEVTSEITTLGAETAHDEETAAPSGQEVVEVNLPIDLPGRADPTTVATIFLPYGAIRDDIARDTRRLRLMLGGVALITMLFMLPFILRASRSLSSGRRHPELQRALRHALDNHELVLHYQPKVDLRTGKVAGVEALVRWDHPSRGLLAPIHFLPAAEETDLIGPLTVEVFDMALAQAAEWRRQGLDMQVAANLSAASLGDRDLPYKLAELLDRHGVPASCILIEMTESAVMENPDDDQRVLAQLHSMGFQLSIDDFGTGYSSLARLDQLPLTELKIDRTFVSRADEAGTGRLVATMIDLAHDLGMRVVGEGVETEEIGALLADAGCDLAQGYHYARPMPASEVEAWMAGRTVAVPAPV